MKNISQEGKIHSRVVNDAQVGSLLHLVALHSTRIALSLTCSSVQIPPHDPAPTHPRGRRAVTAPSLPRDSLSVREGQLGGGDDGSGQRTGVAREGSPFGGKEDTQHARLEGELVVLWCRGREAGGRGTGGIGVMRGHRGTGQKERAGV